MTDWDNFRFILAVSRSKSIREAANMLGVNHSTVSRKLDMLNHHYKTDVFERTRLGYQVTQFGQSLLDAALEMEAIVISSGRKADRDVIDVAGRIKLSIAVPMARYLFSETLQRITRLYPNIELVLDTSEKYVDIDRGEADIVVRSGNKPDEHLVGRKTIPYAVSYYARRDYLVSTPKNKRTWIGFENDAKFPDWLHKSPYPDAPVTMRTTNYEMRYVALCAGMGMSRAACFMADTNPDLVRLEGADVFTTLDLWVLTHPDLRETARIKVVMNELVEGIREKEPLIAGNSPQRILVDA